MSPTVQPIKYLIVIVAIHVKIIFKMYTCLEYFTLEISLGVKIIVNISEVLPLYNSLFWMLMASVFFFLMQFVIFITTAHGSPS